VPPADPGALAGAISALLGDGARREAMGAAAQAFAREHDAAWTARAFEGVYLDARSCHQPGRPRR
jgi:glycosyltransferase involved in cell wall biosynthesis